jgi:competence protein ComEC
LLLASLAVWLVTAPLAIQAFHIVAPVAIPLNLVLLPLVALALQSGFALLVFADLFPPLAPLLALVCQTSLQAMQVTVRTAAAWPASHFWLVDPGLVPVLACYGCVGLTWAIAHNRRRRSLGYLLAVACLLAGWGQKTWARYRFDNVRCSVLSVGHGTCVVLQWPGGPVWLYDAGSRGGIRVGGDRVARYLWAQGIGRIDAMVLSHADLDHYSLMPGLIERFGVRRFYVGPPGLQADDPSEAWLVEELDRRGIVPTIVAAGDQFVCGTECALTVLHPESESRWSNDNARSLVLEVQYRGRRILLPGDLEADGLEFLFTRPSPVIDVAMAPHHGSPHSDPERFLRWCRPRWCIISDSKVSSHSLWVTHSASSGTDLLHTGVHGAVEILLDNSAVYVQTFREVPPLHAAAPRNELPGPYDRRSGRLAGRQTWSRRQPTACHATRFLYVARGRVGGRVLAECRANR